MSNFLAQTLNRDDRGAGLVEYALTVLLIAIGSLALVSNVGASTSETFDETAAAFEGNAAELSPAEQWDQAKEDYDQALVDAKADRAAAKEKAKDDYDAARSENKSLPKDERKAANSAAKQDFNDAKAKATSDYKATVSAAKDAKSAAKAEYKSSK